MRSGGWGVTAGFYGGLGVVLILIWVESLGTVLPDGFAVRVGHNSEGLLLALLLAAWIQFARPRLAGSPHRRTVPTAVALVAFAGAMSLLGSDLPSRFKTLHETLLATAVLVPYLQLRRPLHGWPWLTALGLLLVVIVGHANDVVVLLAESLAMVILALVAFDVIDRGILDPASPVHHGVRWTWYAAMVAVPVVVSVVGSLEPGGALGTVNGYAIRTFEGFLGVLLIQLYFTVGHGRWGASTPSRDRHGGGDRMPQEAAISLSAYRGIRSAKD